MPRNLLTDTSIAEFRFEDTGTIIPLHSMMESLSHSVKPRIATHEYIKRSGGEAEYMGHGVERYSYTINFLDGDRFNIATGQTEQNWRRNYSNLRAEILKNPKGILTDPLLGSIRAVCLGWDNASLNVATALNLITVNVSFQADELDTKAETLATVTVNDVVRDVTDQIAEVTTQIAPYKSAIAQAAVLTTAAATYAVTAANVADKVEADAAADQQLDEVARSFKATETLVLADDAVETDAERYAALEAIELLYAYCLQIAEAIESMRPRVIDFTVQTQTNLAALVGFLYGKDGLDRMDEVQSLNRITNPHAIPAGTVLRISDPTA